MIPVSGVQEMGDNRDDYEDDGEEYYTEDYEEETRKMKLFGKI